MFRRTLLALGLCLLPVAGFAQAPRLQPLLDVLRLPEVLSIVREEGMSHAASIEADMFPDAGGGLWKAEVERIYDVERMTAVMIEGFGTAPDARTLRSITDFFGSELGQRITGLEIAARRAMLDDRVEAAAKDSYLIIQSDDRRRAELLQEFVDSNELIDSNVVGGLNSNYSFYRGLRDGEALDKTMTEEQILRDVWAQEAAIRDDTSEWVFAYLTLAYSKLDDAELRRYVDLSRTEAGRSFNRVLFEAFDVLFKDISYALGQAAGQAMQGKDL